MIKEFDLDYFKAGISFLQDDNSPMEQGERQLIEKKMKRYFLYKLMIGKTGSNLNQRLDWFRSSGISIKSII